LAQAGSDYPAEVQQSDLTLTLPERPALGSATQTVLFPAFGSRRPRLQDQTDPDSFRGTAAVEGSPYAQVYALAQRLAHGARTPYAYVQRVMSYLAGNGYSYDEHPPPTAYPLATFLLVNKIGYCQQFAGSMAFLLRMGGVPARVATGFATGTYDAATKRWLVSDEEAHAWVEAWFPNYGWITFDPTPPAAPARGGRTPIKSSGALGSAGDLSKLGGRNAGVAGTGAVGTAGVHSDGSLSPVLIVLLGVLAVLAVVAFVAWTRSGVFDADGLLAELDRALSRSGRPIADGVTLAALERRFRTSPGASAYIRSLRMARFGGASALPTLGQRRALRAQLRAGLGLGGALRALWALPPRPERLRWRSRPSGGGLH
jgi:hypothetical protein